MNTTYFLNCVAGNVFGTKSDPAIPTTYYIGLSTTAPNINGTGVDEPSTDAGYARVQLTNMSEPLDGVVTNELAINFNESTASWGTITHFVIISPYEFFVVYMKIVGARQSTGSHFTYLHIK